VFPLGAIGKADTPRTTWCDYRLLTEFTLPISSLVCTGEAVNLIKTGIVLRSVSLRLYEKASLALSPVDVALRFTYPGCPGRETVPRDIILDNEEVAFSPDDWPEEEARSREKLRLELKETADHLSSLLERADSRASSSNLSQSLEPPEPVEEANLCIEVLQQEIDKLLAPLSDEEPMYVIHSRGDSPRDGSPFEACSGPDSLTLVENAVVEMGQGKKRELSGGSGEFKAARRAPKVLKVEDPDEITVDEVVEMHVSAEENTAEGGSNGQNDEEDEDEEKCAHDDAPESEDPESHLDEQLRDAEKESEMHDEDEKVEDDSVPGERCNSCLHIDVNHSI